MSEMIEGDEWFISSDCPEALSAMPVLKHDEDKREDVEKTEEMSDDVADDLRYGLKSMLGSRKKPFEVKLHETLAQIPDFTQKHLVRLKMMDQQKGKQRWKR